MSLFGINLPPEILELIKNPVALGDQVKAFVRAANALTDAIDRQKLLADTIGDGVDADLSEADEAVWIANEAFKLEMARLPKLTP